jgi:hypothetical protein
MNDNLKDPKIRTMEPPPLRPPRSSPRRSGERFRSSAPDDPVLVIAPLAWLKLMLFLHAGDTEVGGFGVSRGARGDDLLYLEDLATVRQRTTAVTVAFDDAAVADSSTSGWTLDSLRASSAACGCTRTRVTAPTRA